MNYQTPKPVNQLFRLLRFALSGQGGNKIRFSQEEWGSIFRLASEQGVLGVAGEAVNALPNECKPEKIWQIQWALAMEKRTKHYNRMLKLSAEFAQLLAEKDVTCVVLKGLALAEYYPNPSQREFGDFDCFLCGKYEEGNKLAKDCGAKLDDGGYKHSHIIYKGMTIENHQYLINYAGSKKGKELESLLEDLAKRKESGRIGSSELLIPNDDFMALFTAYHAQRHFLAEGVKLRFLIDWACFLNERQEIVDWKKVAELMKEYKMYNFAAMMTSISVKYLGTQIRMEHVPLADDERTENMFLSDTFGVQPSVYDKNIFKKTLRIMRRFKRMRKFKKLMCNSLGREVAICFLYSSYMQRLRRINR